VSAAKAMIRALVREITMVERRSLQQW
jgi:hypothetical protein